MTDDVRPLIRCDAVHSARLLDERVMIEFDAVTLNQSVACAKRLMLFLVEEVFEIEDE